MVPELSSTLHTLLFPRALLPSADPRGQAAARPPAAWGVARLLLKEEQACCGLGVVWPPHQHLYTRSMVPSVGSWEGWNL